MCVCVCCVEMCVDVNIKNQNEYTKLNVLRQIKQQQQQIKFYDMRKKNLNCSMF